MARVTAPVLSLGARKTIGKTVTFFRSRGMDVARQRVIPANPQTPDQTTQRTAFSEAVALAQLVAAPLKALWKAAATADGKGETWLSRAARACLNVGWLADGTLAAGAGSITVYDPTTGASVQTDVASPVTVQTSADGVTWAAPVAAPWVVGTKTYDVTGATAQAGYIRILSGGALIGFGTTTAT